MTCLSRVQQVGCMMPEGLMEDKFKLQHCTGSEDWGKWPPTCVFLLRGEMHAWLVSA